MKKSKFFRNDSMKVDVILSVFKEGEKLKGAEITRRVNDLGYHEEARSICMFIHYQMIYQHLNKEQIKLCNYYYRLGDS